VDLNRLVLFTHPKEARSITVREAVRLQFFKVTFVFPVPRTHAFKQVGNAIPSLLAQAIRTDIEPKIFKQSIEKTSESGLNYVNPNKVLVVKQSYRWKIQY